MEDLTPGEIEMQERMRKRGVPEEKIAAAIEDLRKVELNLLRNLHLPDTFQTKDGQIYHWTGGANLREGRLYPSKEAAEEQAKRKK